MSNSKYNADHAGLLESEEAPSANQTEPAQDLAERVGQKSGTPSRRHKTIMIASVAALVAVGLGYFIHNAFLFEDTDDAQVEGHVMPLSSRINGQVLKVNFVEGQLVYEGDLLAVIDPADFKISVLQAEAVLADAKATATSSRWNVPITSVTSQSNLDSAETEVVNAEAGVRGAEHSYESAKASLAQDEANAAKSDADLERAKQLVAKEDISRQQFDQAVATVSGRA